MNKQARRHCADCGRKLPFPFITVWFEEAGRSIGIRFGSMTELIRFFTEERNSYATADDWLLKATKRVAKMKEICKDLGVQVDYCHRGGR